MSVSYRYFLKCGKTILNHFISEFIDRNLTFRSASSAASYMCKNQTPEMLKNFKLMYPILINVDIANLTIRELENNVLNLGQILSYLRRKRGNDVKIRSNLDTKHKIAYAIKTHFQNELNEFQEHKINKINKNIERINKELEESKKMKDYNNESNEDIVVDEAFLKHVKIESKNNRKAYEISLMNGESQYLVDNMRNYVVSVIFKNMTFCDTIRIDFRLNDGSYHFDYICNSTLNELYEKFSDHNWDKITNEIHPSEGSDLLILHVDYKRITNIKFTKISKINDKDSNYQTNGGNFFKYLVNSYKPLTDFQIVKELNEETVKIIDEHCLVYAFERIGVKKEILDALKHMICRGNFKVQKLNEIAEFFNLNIKVSYYKLDDEYEKTSSIKSYSFPAVPNEKPEHIIDLIVIDEHFMINKKVSFNLNYYKYEDEINKRIEDIRKTNPELAGSYDSKRFLFKQFNGNHFKFYNEKDVPEHSIFEILRALKQANKFSEIKVSDYWTFYGKIRYQNISKDDSLTELNKYETNLYKSFYNSTSQIKNEYERKFIVFADFEASTDGERHREYCICARKYEANIHNELKPVSEINHVLYKTFEISETFEEFNSYSKNCSVEFLDWLDDNSIVFFHNLTYDINFILKHINDFKSNIIFHGRDMMHNLFYKNKNIIFKDSLAMINCKLSAFPGMFKLNSGEKEAFPYNYYNSENAFNKYGDINEALKYIKPEDRGQFMENIERIEGVKINENTFDMERYALFYCRQDVRILAEGLICFNKMCKEALGIDCLNSLSISGLANKYFEEHVYFKSNNIYKLGGNIRKFIMKTIYGGRCMTRDNEMHKINERLCDFDAVSLYPSAIKRAYILEGKPAIIPSSWNKEYLLKHLFLDDQTKPSKDRFISGFFIKINITKIGRKLHMPIITNRFNEDLPLNVNETGIMYVNHITLQDLIKFQEIEFDLIEGLYYYNDRNIECQKEIQYLFDQRKYFKSIHNPIEQIFKLIMNSIYGKTIMKPINYKTTLINGEGKFKKYESKNYKYMKSVDKFTDSSIYQIKSINSLTKDYNLAQFGSLILSMSKRIICEVFCLAEELDHKIYYTDTDSGHFRESEIQELAKQFKIRYGRELIGTELGQFHCDFNNISNEASMPVSIKSIFLGKKSYIDMLQDNKNNLAFHVRMKGIPADTLERTANEMFKDSIPVYYKGGLFVPERNEGADKKYSIFEMYEYLYNHNSVTFELVSDFSPRFQFNKNRTIQSKNSFTRKISF